MPRGKPRLVAGFERALDCYIDGELPSGAVATIYLVEAIMSGDTRGVGGCRAACNARLEAGIELDSVRGWVTGLQHAAAAFESIRNPGKTVTV